MVCIYIYIMYSTRNLFVFEVTLQAMHETFDQIIPFFFAYIYETFEWKQRCVRKMLCELTMFLHVSALKTSFGAKYLPQVSELCQRRAKWKKKRLRSAGTPPGGWAIRALLRGRLWIKVLSFDHCFHYQEIAGYLEDHPRYRKWLGSPLFTSHEKAMYKGNTPI